MGNHCWESICLAVSCLFLLLHLLFHQKSSTRRSDPNLPDLSDIGIYDEVNKLAGLEINGQWEWFFMCMYWLCADNNTYYLNKSFLCGTFCLPNRWISLWQTVGGDQPTTSVSYYPSDPHQCGQLHLAQGLGKRQLWQGTNSLSQYLSAVINTLETSGLI